MLPGGVWPPATHPSLARELFAGESVASLRSIGAIARRSGLGLARRAVQDWRSGRARRRSRHLTQQDCAKPRSESSIARSRRRGAASMRCSPNEHIFLAFAQVEWDMFAEVMRDIELNPHTILQAIEEHLHMMPPFAGRELRVSPATKLVFKLALHHASRAGRQTIEAADLFSAVFEESAGRAGVDPAPPRRRARACSSRGSMRGCATSSCATSGSRSASSCRRSSSTSPPT